MMFRYLFVLLLFQSVNSGISAQTEFYAQLADSAETLTNDHVVYDPAYYSMDYPGGDVPPDKGVCTDVVIRAYRKLGIDLQKKVHEDMKKRFREYPDLWGLTRPEKNIDHRRVPNLMEFFKTHGTVKSGSLNAGDYAPGDVVCWQLSNGMTHIGITASKKDRQTGRYLIVHNIGAGQVLEDVLFEYKIIGHYRYGGE